MTTSATGRSYEPWFLFDVSANSMRAAGTILAATIAAHLVGSVVLFGVVSGPAAAIFAPVLALFGRFFVVPELLASGAQWFAYRPSDRRKKLPFLMVSASIAAPAVAVVGPKESGRELQWAIGYALAAAAAAIASGLIIQYAKRPR